MQSDVQSLITQLSSTSSGSGSSTTGASSDTLDALQQSFQNLVSALGGSGSGAPLTNFLQTLSSGLGGASASGSMVSTQA
jgi:hypothetical protein